MGIVGFTRRNIDVVIPFHQVNDYLEEAIESILDSQKIDVRIILIDDRKHREHKINWLDPRVKVFETEGEEGYRKSILLGITKSTAEYIAFQDSDDLSHPMRLFEQLELLVTEGVDITACSITKINKNNSKKIIGKFSHMLPEQDFMLPLLIGSVNANSTWVLKSNVAKDPLYFSGKELSSDWATAFRIFDKYQIRILEKKYYFYRQHAKQTTKNFQYQKKAFSEIYDLWSACNEKYKLPKLSKTEGQFIADPWNIGVFNKNTESWIDAFLALNQKHGNRNINTYKAILGYRCIKHIVNHRKFPNMRLVNLALKFTPYCIFFGINEIWNSKKGISYAD
jgi:glycosyltransferase involved in cell wall biosynthesis